ncbi:unnamed protein product [Soboliphyme baturini]|uniref:Clathrin adaptor alpha-adaptin appendage C-terminal subdomain domain-containing protein n=1 Tax=Soboliphyme baturini TaxID=241478 RepID=A0A183IXU5_9BILA|nr:unnamed protein product [Soboliphyme baturini]
MENRQNLARMGIFFGNKSTSPLLSFTPQVSCPGVLSTQIVLQAKQVDPFVDAGAQVQQLINVECVAEFYACPVLNVRFVHNAEAVNICLQLPLFLFKFFEAVDMPAQLFFERWKQLNHCFFLFQLTGFGMQVLEGVDPNADNFVAAGIIHTKTVQIGCLLRLEPKLNAFRLTVRSSRSTVASYVCLIASELF